MTKVLLYNIEKGKAAKIKMLCHKLNIASQTVSKEEFGLKLKSLLGLDDDKTVKADSDFDEEMLYLADFYGAMLNIFLNQLKRQKTPVALKAVKTDTNIEFTSYELYREISAEREVLNNK
ncbi:MAG TPA: hypothetical protein DEO32_00320 [Ruminococcaceae bacterium]|nr:hypothetical protein [Oscillospiraceae bacterium]